MDRSSVLLIVLISIIASVVSQTSNYDCRKRPNLNQPELKNCCKRPTVNIDKYKASCYNTTANISSQAYMDPCGVECIFTKSGALNNGIFNLTNLQTLFNTIMPKDTDLAKVFVAGFKTCAPDVQAKIKANESKRKFKFPGTSPCSPFAVMTSFCAMRYTFINCPANLWTSSDLCNSAQIYAKNCDPMNLGGGTGSNITNSG